MDSFGRAPMKASDLASLLIKLISEHGDLPVCFPGSGDGDCFVRQVVAYNKTGNDSGKRTQIYLHGH